MIDRELAPLRVILPRPAETELLRACLLSGEPGRRAWGACRARLDDPRTALGRAPGGVKALAPLLLEGLQRNGVTVEASLLTYLRTARLREELRTRTYQAILRGLLGALAGDGVPFVVVGDAALAEVLYREPALRHPATVELLLEDGHLTASAARIAALGFGEARAGSDEIGLRHDSGLPVILKTRLFRSALYRSPGAELWLRSRPRVLAGVPARVLSPADMLLHVCGHASYDRGRASLRWACDAWLLIARGHDLDWGRLVESAALAGLAPALFVALEYLARDLDAPVPGDALEGLGRAAFTTGAADREMALAAARGGSWRTWLRMVRLAPGWRAGAALLAGALWPSRGYLERMYPLVPSWAWPLARLYRPLRYLGSTVRRGLGRRRGSGTVSAWLRDRPPA